MEGLTRLEAYLALEREMLRLDAAGDEMAEVLRDAMDPLWQGLGPDERRFLNERSIPSATSDLEPIHGPLYRVEVQRPPGDWVDVRVLESASWRPAA